MSTLAELLTNRQEEKRKCAKHGEYVSKQIVGDIWTRCPVCEAEYEEKILAKERAEKKARWEQEWAQRLTEANIPERFRTKTLDSYDAQTDGEKKAHRFAKDYAARFAEMRRTGKSAIFIGRLGTGKTHLAIGIALRVMGAQNRTAQYTTVMKAIRRVKDSWSRESRESETQAVDVFAKPDLLILDEVGVQSGTEFERNILFDLLNTRYEKRKPTILISNLEVDEIREFLGERIFDRLREDGGEIIPFTWVSHRGQ